MSFLSTLLSPEKIIQTIQNPEDKIVKIKLLCNWTSPAILFHQWKRMSQDNDGHWNSIVLTLDDDVDFYIIINHAYG